MLTVDDVRSSRPQVTFTLQTLVTTREETSTESWWEQDTIIDGKILMITNKYQEVERHQNIKIAKGA